MAKKIEGRAAEVVRLYRLGYPWNRIAREVGTNEGMVGYWIREARARGEIKYRNEGYDDGAIYKCSVGEDWLLARLQAGLR